MHGEEVLRSMTPLGRIAAFGRLARVKFLAGGVIGAGLGTAVAAFEGHAIDVRAYAIVQVAVTALQLMTHYANDYFDREADALAERTPFSGGSGVLVDGSLPPNAALASAFACLAIGLLGAVVLILTGRGTAGAIVLGVAALAWAYSAPPRLLGRGWGELDTALVVAVLVPAAAYAAQTGTLSVLAVASCLPGAAAMFTMMLAVEYPDLEADAATGKLNLVVRKGRDRAVRLAYAGVAASALGVGAALLAGAPPALLPLIALALPAAAGLLGALRRADWQRAGLSEIAARGVMFFFTIGLGMLLGYLAAA
jgi:1,4-dihydroxy-2-naphthoate polyprenyltransferase